MHDTSNLFGLKLSAPRIVMTKFGEREVCSGKPTDAFWDEWNRNPQSKEALKKQGYMIGLKFGQEMVDGKKNWEVTVWTQTMSHEDRVKAAAASWADNADIAVPKPGDCPHDYYPFQKAGIAFALEREGTLIGDEQGLGKTIQGVGFANIVGAKKILVIAPATLLANWRLEIMKWQTLGLPVFVIRPGVVFTAKPNGWYVVNYDIVGRYDEILKSVEWDLLIADECHALKTPDAKRTKLILGNLKGDFQAIKAKRRLMMTGTPILNRPVELFPILHNLDPKRWDNLGNFKRKYCGGWDGQGASNLEELNQRLRETVMVRRLKKDVLKELPAKRRQVVPIAVEDEELAAIIQEELAIYERREKEMIETSAAVQRAEAEGNEELYKAAVEKLRELEGIAFNEMARVRHETALRKVGYVIEFVKAALDEDDTKKILVFGHHADVMDALIDGLKDYGVVSITGRTPNHKRQPIVEAFQTDPQIRVFAGNIQAAGVGLTLTASSHVVFAELDWTPAKVSQAEDRVHRIGQKESVLIQHVVLDGSLDAKIAKMLVAKQAIIDKALNDRIEAKPDPERPVPQVEADEAVTLVPDQMPTPKPIDARRVALDEVAASLTPTQIRGIQEALQVLASMDSDRARELNDVGFNKMDTVFGCELAAKDNLSPRQAAAAMKMVRKYRRQYSPALYRTIFGEDWE